MHYILVNKWLTKEKNVPTKIGDRPPCAKRDEQHLLYVVSIVFALAMAPAFRDTVPNIQLMLGAGLL